MVSQTLPVLAEPDLSILDMPDIESPETTDFCSSVLESTEIVLEDIVAQNQSKNYEGNIQKLTENNRSQNISEICASDALAMPADASLSVLESPARKAGQSLYLNSTNCACKN
jgi:hypothetical protein